jgi:hypothetical protein
MNIIPLWDKREKGGGGRAERGEEVQQKNTKIIIIFVIVIIITIIIYHFMHVIFTYVSETNYVSRNRVLQLFCSYRSWCIKRSLQC